MRLSLFAKFLKMPSLAELVDTQVRLGFTEAQVLVRDGHLVAPASLARDLPAFVLAHRAAGLPCTHAVLGSDATTLIADPSPLHILAQHGVQSVRIGYEGGPAAQQAAILDTARQRFAALASVCQQAGITAVVQVHHGRPIASPTAAWYVTRECDPRWLAVELDAGNQAFEGHEDWFRAVALLGKHLSAIGVKDAGPVQQADGSWTLRFCPIGHGMQPWAKIIAATAGHHRSLLWDFQPFYHEHDRDAHLRTLADEVQQLRRLLDAATANTSSPPSTPASILARSTP